MPAEEVSMLQVYEEQAVLEWVRMRHTVPHSPGDPAAEHHVQPCGPMRALIREFGAEFWEQLTLVPGQQAADPVLLDPALVM